MTEHSRPSRSYEWVYGVVHLESAGEHAEERIRGGIEELDVTGATEFYRSLTDAQTK